MTTTQQILLKAADILEQPGAWTKHALARDVNDNEVKPEAAEAVSFCAMGALDRAAYQFGRDSHQAFCDLWNYLGTSIATWNNDERRTQAEVVEALREAAELANG